MMDTSNRKEHPKMEEDVERTKEIKEEEVGSRNSSVDIANSRSGPD
jgi:hypothetical protein